ncbi:hypothetical protein HO173_004134 [Letharia columbiana]|uniref:Uncharacterized protein n=1 Tax=Letharia columbiana TaxID=112416 RepID=A0A8H6G000_9LECA|nr:uncharacterized protein HO173_004134 [Letharia columbiana]KAF6237933.1 hypothetical protein HO173_004134 [Letharia columbiana]
MASSSLIPGFSAEQVRSITKLIEDVLDKALDKHFGTLPPRQKQSVIAPKPAQPPKQEQEHRPLQQAKMKNCGENCGKNTENIAEKQSIASSSSPIQEGTLSTIPHQATMHISGEPSLASAIHQFSPPLSPLFHLSTRLSARLYSSAKDMEAIGQG